MSRGGQAARRRSDKPLAAVNGVIDLRLPARQTAPLISPHSETDYDPAFVAELRFAPP